MSFLLEPLLKGTRELYGRIPLPSADAPFEPALEPEAVLPSPPPTNPSTNPYYPPGVVVPDYAPNEATVLVLLPALAGLLGAALLAGLLVARRRNPGLTRVEGAVFCWFLLCESCVLEYFPHLFDASRHFVSSMGELTDVYVVQPAACTVSLKVRSHGFRMCSSYFHSLSSPFPSHPSPLHPI
jgi:hypothetical protein